MVDHEPYIYHTDGFGSVLADDLSFSSEPKGQIPGSAAGRDVCSCRVDGGILGILYLSGCIRRVLQYVRKPYDNRADHVVDVFLYVLYLAWRGDECIIGREDIRERIGKLYYRTAKKNINQKL